MELLLDHMLGKKVQSLLISQGHNAIRAIELGLHEITNGELYEEACKQNKILVTCDSDYDGLRIGKTNSIIYLNPRPTNAIKYLIPFITKNFTKVEDKFLSSYLIIVNEDQIMYNDFNS